MTGYRRSRLCGGTYFFTVALANRRSSLLIDRIADLRAAFQYALARHPFRMEAIIVLPDHLHALWQLPPLDADYSLRWRLIKTEFSRAMPPEGNRPPTRARKGERTIWQRRYWEHLIRDDTDFVRHVDYVHYNPVKHGYVERASEWPYSSFHQYVRLGVLPHEWAGADVSNEWYVGES